MAPEAEERIGDVSNVVFSNGWIVDQDGTVFIYYAHRTPVFMLLLQPLIN